MGQSAALKKKWDDKQAARRALKAVKERQHAIDEEIREEKRVLYLSRSVYTYFMLYIYIHINNVILLSLQHPNITHDLL